MMNAVALLAGAPLLLYASVGPGIPVPGAPPEPAAAGPAHLGARSALSPATGAPAAAADTQRAVLTMSRGDSLVSVDSLSRQGDRVWVRAHVTGARLVIVALLAEDESIAEARVRVWPTGSLAPQVDLEITHEGNRLGLGATGSEERDEQVVPANTLIFLPPTLTAVEQAVRHAVAVRGDADSVALSLWVPYRGGQAVEAIVSFPAPDTAAVSAAGSTYTLAVDGAGNILGGRLEPAGYAIAREEQGPAP